MFMINISFYDIYLDKVNFQIIIYIIFIRLKFPRRLSRGNDFIF